MPKYKTGQILMIDPKLPDNTDDWKNTSPGWCWAFRGLEKDRGVAGKIVRNLGRGIVRFKVEHREHRLCEDWLVSGEPVMLDDFVKKFKKRK